MKKGPNTTRREAGQIGNKALNLKLLEHIGLPVPSFVSSQDFLKPEQQAHLEVWLSSQPRNENKKWALAIRSSSRSEDGFDESKAGHFLSVLGEFSKESLMDAVERVKSSGDDVAVIVQLLVEPKYSGVLFSCDPLSYDRGEMRIAWTAGLSEKLLSGEEVGENVSLNSLNEVIEGHWPSSTDNLSKLTSAVSQLEREFGSPVDIEWAIDAENEIWFLQVRPVVLPQNQVVELHSPEQFQTLPAVLAGHHKIRLRKRASELGITMSPASVIVSRDNARSKIEPDMGIAEAASVVLLHPEHIKCKIVREFAPTRGDGVKSWTERCRRYSVRRYPKVENIASAVRSVSLAGLSQSWFSAVLTQAVWDAPATGIIRRTQSGYIIDVAQGHFVPKGVVEVSTAILDREHSLEMIDWREQTICYHFVDGHVISEAPPKTQLRLKNDVFANIARTLDPLFDEYTDAALEFGILGDHDEYQVYLIDIAEGDVGSIALDSDLISTGVISAGRCAGKIKIIQDATGEAFDKHLHDRRDESLQGSEQLIVVAEFPSTELLSHACFPQISGFIFKKASILAHLPVVLRERGIPAIVLNDESVYAQLREGTEVEIDASSRMLNAADRIRIGA